jgi:chemotaxis protein MotB
MAKKFPSVARDIEDLEGSPQHSSWAVSYADLVTLLLCFFILFFNVDQVKTAAESKKNEKKNTIIETIGDKIRPVESPNASINETSKDELKDTKPIDAASNPPVKNLPESLLILSKRIKDNPLAEVGVFGDQISLQIADIEFFKRGSIALTTDGKRQIDSVMSIIDSFKNDILVEIIGHSDNIPVKRKVQVNGMTYSSNLELSTLRAMNVLSYMNKLGMPLDSMVIAGHSNSRPIGEMLKDKTLDLGFQRRVSFTIKLKHPD